MYIKKTELSSGNMVKIVYLTEQDKKNIDNMCPECNVYSQFDSEKDTDEVIKVITQFKQDCEKGDNL